MVIGNIPIPGTDQIHYKLLEVWLMIYGIALGDVNRSRFGFILLFGWHRVCCCDNEASKANRRSLTPRPHERNLSLDELDSLTH